MYVQIVENLKNFNIDRASMDELLLAQIDINALRAGYERNAIPVPEWVADQARTVALDITRRTRDDIERRRKEIDAQLTQLEPSADKRARLQKERDELNQKLAGETANTPQPV